MPALVRISARLESRAVRGLLKTPMQTILTAAYLPARRAAAVTPLVALQGD